MPARVLLALDTPDVATAVSEIRTVGAWVDGAKLGLEFFLANGKAGVERVQKEGQPLFLDLKFHDIPNTVAGAIHSVLPLKPMMLNVHASGGPEMLRRAADTVHAAEPARPLLIAVTVLTSLEEQDLIRIGQQTPVGDQVCRLAALAQKEGCDGVVCSAREIQLLRRECGPEFKLVVPGVRPAGAALDDQKRVMTPGEASALGADFLVIGRAITAAADPADAARRIRREIAGR
jgi:orotidine-5'-phosphate decarboxylase